MYVTTNIIGGLGNQLFQIFATLNYALNCNKQAVFSNQKILTCPGSTTRYSYWDTFLKNIAHLTTNSISTIFIPYNEENNIIPIPCNNANIRLVGYFQSYKYFKENEEKIFKLIKLKEIKNCVAVKYNEYFEDFTYKISMHFRLGDYKNLQDYHPIQPYEYYKKALYDILLNTCVLNVKVLYFCESEDDKIISVVIEKLSKEFPFVKFKKVANEIPDWEQIIIMSLCNSNIIANSSFSWWGAYFNNNKRKVVTYPSLWFGKKINKDVSDMFPPEWIKI